jgi:predicted aspartyl protease
VKDTPPLPHKNYFNVLAVEEIKDDSSAPTDVSPVPETAQTEKPRKLKLEKRLPKKLSVGAAEVGPNSLYLRVEIESMDNQRKYGVCALVDSGATGLFIDREYVKSNQIPTMKLSQPIPVFNVDGTANTEGSISEVAELLLRYNGHSERALFCVTRLRRQNLILGHTWLKDHNPEVDWRTGKVEMSRCSPRCCNGCQTEAREERRMLKREAASINACRSGSFPAMVEDAEEEDSSDDEPATSDIPFDIEEEDRVWATGLIPEAQYVQATSTISQRLAEGFARNLEAKPTLPTGGSGSKNPIPDYVKIFGQVFLEEGFVKLLNRKPWDHVIELVPGAQPKGCKVYPISVTEQSELDSFLTENLKTGRIRQSKSPMASPVFFIKKKDGSLQLVQDYRMLNDMTVKNKYPLPLISKLVNQLRGAKYFTKLDVRWGFNNVRIQEGDEWKAMTYSRT